MLEGESGVSYTLIDGETQAVPEGTVIKRKGKNLEVEVGR